MKKKNYKSRFFFCFVHKNYRSHKGKCDIVISSSPPCLISEAFQMSETFQMICERILFFWVANKLSLCFLFGCFRRHIAEKQNTDTQKKNAAENIQISTWPVGNRDSWFYHRNKERHSDFLPLKTNASIALGYSQLGMTILELMVRLSVRLWNRSMPQTPTCQEQVRLRKSPMSLPLLAAWSSRRLPESIYHLANAHQYFLHLHHSVCVIGLVGIFRMQVWASTC